MAQSLVESGLRAQLRTGNLLTGQLYIAMDFFPDAPQATIDWSNGTPEIPTIQGGLQPLQDSINGLVQRLNKVPVDEIASDLRQAIRGASTLMRTLGSSVAPEARAAMISARAAMDAATKSMQPVPTVAQGMTDTMRELTRAAAALRSLAEYLDRHPEALVRGKQEVK